MNMGTPVGRQEEFAVNWILPASISWLSFFITSLAHCFRLGLERSPNRKLTTGLTKGWLGSWRTGRAEPCTAGKAPPKGCVHPPGPDWKSGTWAGCALTRAASAETSASPPPAMSKGLDADLIIVSLPVSCCNEGYCTAWLRSSEARRWAEAVVNLGLDRAFPKFVA